MCKVRLKIKGLYENSPKEGFVPCGRCRDCRNVMRSSWYFRLRAEFENLAALGWRFAFFTLTYNEMSLPIVPLECFPDCRDYQRKACFSRDDVRDFVHSFRQWLYRTYGVKGSRYMICSEYGEHTKRPHYHGVIAVPSFVDMSRLCEWMREAWKDKGFLIPRPEYASEGGYDKRGRYHYPFEVDACHANIAAWYAAKYCCKDLNFCESVGNLRVDRKCKAWKYSQPFHMQSRSLGIGALSKILTDSQKLEALFNGFSFLGEDKLTPIPVYIRNKILFTPKYIVDKNGKRLVRRECTDFFKRYYKEVYAKKREYYAVIASSSVFSEFWETQGLDKENARSVANECFRLAQAFADVRQDSFGLADMYVAFYGVPYNRCFFTDPAKFWFNRYYPEKLVVGDNLRLSKKFLDSANCFWQYVLENMQYLKQEKNARLLRDDREYSRFHDYITSIED